jgi:hypothetical protein
MKHSPNNRRSRRPNGRRGNQNVRNQTFESNGPEGRIRGTAQQVLEKYLALARDAASAGEHIQAEAFYQHAEHYFRLLNSDPNYQNRQGDQRRPTPADSDPASYADDDDDAQQGGERSGGDKPAGGEPAGTGEQPDIPAAAEGGSDGGDGQGQGNGRGRGRRRGNGGQRDIPIETSSSGDESGTSGGASNDSGKDAAPQADAEATAGADTGADGEPRKRGPRKPRRRPEADNTESAGTEPAGTAAGEESPAAE